MNQILVPVLNNIKLRLDELNQRLDELNQKYKKFA